VATTASLLMMLLLQTAPPPPVEEPTVSVVTIVGVGARPQFGSGIIKSSVLVLGRDEEGVTSPYYMIYFGADQALPALGSRCTITHHPGRLEYVGGLEIAPFLTGEEFEDIECGPAPTFEAFAQSEWRRQRD
jgi:hypothetical protein